jgi:hypothetical protein
VGDVVQFPGAPPPERDVAQEIDSLSTEDFEQWREDRMMQVIAEAEEVLGAPQDEFYARLTGLINRLADLVEELPSPPVYES